MSRTLGMKPKTQLHRCRFCGRRLRPSYETRQVQTYYPDGTFNETEYHYTGAVRGYGYRNQGLFCSLGCGYEFACRAVRALEAERR